jgi:uncharacterized protein YukE
MGFTGADADALDQAAQRMERAGRQLLQRSQRLQRTLMATPWRGPTADRFRSEFNSVHLRAVSEAAAFLDEAQRALHHNADQQRKVSSAGSGAIGSPVRPRPPIFGPWPLPDIRPLPIFPRPPSWWPTLPVVPILPFVPILPIRPSLPPWMRLPMIPWFDLKPMPLLPVTPPWIPFVPRAWLPDIGIGLGATRLPDVIRPWAAVAGFPNVGGR